LDLKVKENGNQKDEEGQEYEIAQEGQEARSYHAPGHPQLFENQNIVLGLGGLRIFSCGLVVVKITRTERGTKMAAKKTKKSKNTKSLKKAKKLEATKPLTLSRWK
jgi:uncharacterized FAD-dependent dehydrogenase